MHNQEKGIEKEKFKLFNFRFFTALLLFSALGIGLALLLYNYVACDYIVTILSGTVILTGLMLSGKKKWKICVCCFVFALFYLYTVGTVASRVSDKTDYQVDFLEVKIEYVSSDGSVVHCSFDKGEGSLTFFNEYIPREGEKLLLEDVHVKSVNVVNGDGTFDTFSLNQTKRYTVHCSGVYEVRDYMPSMSQSIRAGIKNALKDYPQDVRGIINALLTGDKYGIDPDIYTDYKDAGVAHVLAVSGLHVVFLYSAVDILLKKCRVKKKIRAFASIPILFVFSATCSFAPSVVRASFMTALHKVIPACSRKRYDTLSVMSFSAFVLLLLNPMNLINYGFLLSYGAVFGILAFNGKIESKLYRLPGFLRKTLATSTAVSLTTFPLSVLFFGTVSVVSALTNILVLPVLGAFYGLIFAVGIICAIFPFLSFLIAPCSLSIYYINFVANSVASLPFCTISSVAPVWFLGGYYFCLVLLSDYLFLNKEFKKATICILFGLILFWMVI